MLVTKCVIIYYTTTVNQVASACIYISNVNKDWTHEEQAKYKKLQG